MTASIRNQLVGKVKSIVSDKVMSEIMVETAAGPITSVITTNSVKALKLRKGDQWPCWSKRRMYR